MKTLTLLACICVLSACFSLSEGRKKPWKIQHKKNNVQQHTLDRRLQQYPKFQPNWNLLTQKHLIFGPHKYPKPSHPIRRKPKPKPPRPSKCPAKNNTAVNNNTSGATTQIPSLSPTSTSNKITESPGVTSPIQNTTPLPVRDNTSAGSSAATPSPQPSPALPDTTAAPLTSSPTLPETTAAPPTSSLTTPAQPSPVPLGSTAAPNTTPNPSPTTPAPDTSETTIAPTTQTTTPATIQNTTVEQPTSPSSQNENSRFWQYIYDIIKYLSGIIPNK
ncbi:mucin-7 [Ursus arctos]|uniref:mucin-7 n=1 Tax=Ursus arctos TaxID=9644 RepID=UPI001CF90A99|nr:mucin-7 [Ursus arctos]